MNKYKLYPSFTKSVLVLENESPLTVPPGRRRLYFLDKKNKPYFEIKKFKDFESIVNISSEKSAISFVRLKTMIFLNDQDFINDRDQYGMTEIVRGRDVDFEYAFNCSEIYSLYKELIKLNILRRFGIFGESYLKKCKFSPIYCMQHKNYFLIKRHVFIGYEQIGKIRKPKIFRLVETVSFSGKYKMIDKIEIEHNVHFLNLR